MVAENKRGISPICAILFFLDRGFAPRLHASALYLLAIPSRPAARCSHLRDTRLPKTRRPTRLSPRLLRASNGGKEGPGIYLHLEPDDCSSRPGLSSQSVNRRRVSDALPRARPIGRGQDPTREFASCAARKARRWQNCPSSTIRRTSSRKDTAQGFHRRIIVYRKAGLRARLH